MTMLTINSQPSALALKALEAAYSYIGTQEIPKNSNKGPQIKKFLASVGLNEGYAWCQAFVYFCYVQAAKDLKLKNIIPKTAGVLNHWNTTTSGIKVVIPKIGDLFVMDFGAGKGHIGFVSKVNLENKTFETVEGNSNDEGSREGFEVAHRTNKLSRKISSVKGFIRY